MSRSYKKNPFVTDKNNKRAGKRFANKRVRKLALSEDAANPRNIKEYIHNIIFVTIVGIGLKKMPLKIGKKQKDYNNFIQL